jgi:uncharacterized protein YkwD
MRSPAAIAVAVLCTLVLAAPASSDANAKVERRASLEAAIVHEMNRVREARGLDPLDVSPGLRTAARDHTRSMLRVGFFGHDSADGTPFSDRIRRHYTNRGWRTWSVGEALLASEVQGIDAHQIVEAWLQSPPHRVIILSTTWKDAGIGALYAPTAPNEYGGAGTVAVTADFGMREGKLDAS